MSRPSTLEEVNRKSIGRGATLYHDYYKIEEIRTVIFNLCEDIGFKARELGLAGKTVSLAIRYSRDFKLKGFHAQKTMETVTNLDHEIMEVAMELLHKKYKAGSPVRKISVSLNNLLPEDNMQLNLFKNKDDELRLARTKDKIRKKYGLENLAYGLSYFNGSIRTRLDNNIGGHKK